jgi:hypothetical protein
VKHTTAILLTDKRITEAVKARYGTASGAFDGKFLAYMLEHLGEKTLAAELHALVKEKKPVQVLFVQ